MNLDAIEPRDLHGPLRGSGETADDIGDVFIAHGFGLGIQPLAVIETHLLAFWPYR
ncbi:hypothetical protein D3C81_2314080 [compost metagenome]